METYSDSGETRRRLVSTVARQRTEAVRADMTTRVCEDRGSLAGLRRWKLAAPRGNPRVSCLFSVVG
ncbi:hypothetical protein EPI10_015693 [Gossypium australe]|uniref:Uncharacterized protein n=1 Tax=Gossypium australe TaxID=47621 RepID=A0A5B6VLK7_9ROSI|nr:hypothetical protein EPI10_015693 [Gossypium australe]